MGRGSKYPPKLNFYPDNLCHTAKVAQLEPDKHPKIGFYNGEV